MQPWGRRVALHGRRCLGRRRRGAHGPTASAGGSFAAPRAASPRPTAASSAKRRCTRWASTSCSSPTAMRAGGDTLTATASWLPAASLGFRLGVTGARVSTGLRNCGGNSVGAWSVAADIRGRQRARVAPRPRVAAAAGV